MFTFSPLDHDRKEIRLLTIAPGAWDNLDDILNCEILHIARMKTVHTHDQNDGSVDDDEAMQERQGEKPRNTRMSCGNEEVDVDDDLETGSYETISYAWGDPAQRATILLNGVTFDIAKSSEQALRRVRLLHRPRTVWIDAVCINQTDIAERSQQVAIMADIYRSGRRNIVYLGEATSSTGTAINSINHLMDTAIADAINDGQSLVDKVFSSDGSFRYDPAGLQLASNEDALAEFYSRPWFRSVKTPINRTNANMPQSTLGTPRSRPCATEYLLLWTLRDRFVICPYDSRMANTQARTYAWYPSGHCE